MEKDAATSNATVSSSYVKAGITASTSIVLQVKHPRFLVIGSSTTSSLRRFARISKSRNHNGSRLRWPLEEEKGRGNFIGEPESSPTSNPPKNHSGAPLLVPTRMVGRLRLATA